MIANRLATEATNYLAAVMPTTVTVLQAGADATAQRPSAVVQASEVEEFDNRLRGTWWVTLEVEVRSVPEDDALGTVEAWIEALEMLFRCRTEMEGMLMPVARQVWDFEQLPGVIDTEDNFRLVRVGSRLLLTENGDMGEGVNFPTQWIMPFEGDGTATLGPNMTLTGTPTFYSPGIGGSSYLTLNGTSQSGQAATPLVMGQTLTVCMWLKTADTAADVFDSMGTAGLNWALSGTDFVITVDGLSGQLVHTLGGGVVNDDTWRHVAVTVERRTNAVRMWLDGREQTLTKTVDTLTTADDAENVQPRVGGSTATGWLAGSMDELRVYNTLLSETEIRTLIQLAGVQLTPAGGIQWSPDGHVILLPR